MFKGDFEIKINTANNSRFRTLTQQRTTKQILQFIRAKRSKINTNIDSGEEEEFKQRINRLVLPKILSMRHDSCHAIDPITVSRLSNYTKSTQKRKQSYQKSYHTLERSEMIDVYEKQQEEVELVKHTEQLFEIINEIPKINKQKSIDKLLPLIQFLILHNPLFKNISKTTIYALIKTSKMQYFQQNKWIYKKNDRLASFYVILWGKVRVINSQKNFKKTSVKGQTLSQHVLFIEWNENNIRGQGAKTSSECFVLEVSYKTYLKLNKDIVLKGFKSEFLALETLIRRNYILKQSLRKQVQYKNIIK